jgi:hypothetical protein
MSFNLYDALIPNFQQTLGAVAGLIDKGEAFATEQGLSPDDIIGAKLIGDMLPFAYQVKSTTEHSLGAITATRAGVFSPSMTPPPASFADLRKLVADTRAALAAVDAAEVNGFIGRDMRFEFGQSRMDFTAENFLLSFSLPNFYFHATTAYDILRMKGVKIGKRDFIGMPRLKM